MLRLLLNTQSWVCRRLVSILNNVLPQGELNKSLDILLLMRSSNRDGSDLLALLWTPLSCLRSGHS